MWSTTSEPSSRAQEGPQTSRRNHSPDVRRRDCRRGRRMWRTRSRATLRYCWPGSTTGYVRDTDSTSECDSGTWVRGVRGWVGSGRYGMSKRGPHTGYGGRDGGSRRDGRPSGSEPQSPSISTSKMSLFWVLKLIYCTHKPLTISKLTPPPSQKERPPLPREP